MTNEEKSKQIIETSIGELATAEKAREIAKKNALHYYSLYLEEDSLSECITSAFDMAKWKDEQFKKYLEKELENNQTKFIESVENDDDSTQFEIVRDFIEKIQYDLFGMVKENVKLEILEKQITDEKSNT